MSLKPVDEPSSCALVTRVDEIEQWVEEVRAKASLLIEEKDAVYMAIDAVKYKLNNSSGLVPSKFGLE